MEKGIDYLGRILTASLCNTIQTMTGFSVDKEEPMDESFHPEIAGAMLLSGMKNLLLVISVNRNTAELLISYMTGIDYRELKAEDLQDGITEFANMVAGSAKESLVDTEYEYHLSIPFAIIGDNIRIISKRKTDKFSHRFKNDEVDILIQIFSFR